MAATPFFPASYQEARLQFLQLADAVRAKVASWRHPSVAPDGGPLTTDVAMMTRPGQRLTIVVQSGTHGIEGLAGSAVQLELMRRMSVGDDVGIVLIHAINPWGFAHFRRVDENNVDLNRNFVDHAQAHPENPAYDQLSDVIAPTSVSLGATVRSAAKIARFSLVHGWSGIRAAISSGQYRHPKGLFFGGREASWANRVFRHIITEAMNPAENVVFVDVHTGLGPPGHCEILLNDEETSEPVRRAREYWGDLVRSTKGEAAVSADLHGSLKAEVGRLLTGREVTAVTLEFGTIGSVGVFRAMQLENWLHHWGRSCAASTRRAIRKRMKDAFLVDKDEWKIDVVGKAARIVAAAARCHTAV